ncbi:MAG TPA: hypothetical protein VMB82_12860 [Acidimicrobiales bacterium]|nr:hypothetical protein [Acidimicrobiales bacterium]
MVVDDESLYRDSRIECSPEGVSIRGYYVPWGTKHTPYDTIRGVERFELGAGSGRWRIWGSGDLRHWANDDPARPHKPVGLYLRLARRIVPFITPDDPEAAEAVIRERAHLGPG